MWFKKTYLKAVAFVLALIPKKNVPVVVPLDIISNAVTQQELDNVIQIVNNVRNVVASPLAVLLTDLIPTTIDDTIRLALVNGLSVLLAGLMFYKHQLDVSNQETAMENCWQKSAFRIRPIRTRSGIHWHPGY